jgi:hypothetical protein
MRRVSSVLEVPDGQEAQPTIPEGTPVMSRWFLSGRQGLRDAMRYLELVKADVEASGRVREEWKEGLDRAFGVGFFELLTKWTPMHRDAY